MTRAGILLVPLLAIVAAGSGCATDGEPGSGSGGHVRCRTVLETRPGPGGFGTQTVPVQRCEPYEAPPPQRDTDPTKAPVDPTQTDLRK